RRLLARGKQTAPVCIRDQLAPLGHTTTAGHCNCCGDRRVVLDRWQNGWPLVDTKQTNLAIVIFANYTHAHANQWGHKPIPSEQTSTSTDNRVNGRYAGCVGGDHPLLN